MQRPPHDPLTYHAIPPRQSHDSIPKYGLPITATLCADVTRGVHGPLDMICQGGECCLETSCTTSHTVMVIPISRQHLDLIVYLTFLRPKSGAKPFHGCLYLEVSARQFELVHNSISLPTRQWLCRQKGREPNDGHLRFSLGARPASMFTSTST
jgi:hypothetical protein